MGESKRTHDDRRARDARRAEVRRERLRADRRLTPAERLERGFALSRFAVDLREAGENAKRR